MQRYLEEFLHNSSKVECLFKEVDLSVVFRAHFEHERLEHVCALSVRVNHDSTDDGQL